MAILDLSKYKQTVGTYSEVDANKATEERFRSLDAGIHECVLVEFKKMRPYNATPEDVDSICVIAKDPNWIMFTPVFANAAGQRTPVSIMMPLTGDLQYKGKSGPTTFPYKTFMDFVCAIGFDPLDDERPEITFMRAITNTDAECLLSLVGAQVKVKVEWSDGKYVHPFYDFENKVFWLVTAEGGTPEDLNEPFTVNKDAKGDERWAEMAVKAKEAGYLFESQSRVKVLRHDTVKNDLSVFFPKKVVKAAAAITKVAAKPLAAAPKPTIATIAKPPVATKPEAAVVEEAMLEDDTAPVEE